MEQNSSTQCNHHQDAETPQVNENQSNVSTEINVNSLEYETPKTSAFNQVPASALVSHLSVISPPSSSINQPLTTQPLRKFSNLPSPLSLNVPPRNKPQSLLLQALAKFNESSTCFGVLNQMQIPVISSNLASQTQAMSKFVNVGAKLPELSAPDSLTSAPPSYSFVLRQMAARRQPRLMGTFIPSPSFVQHTPPPNYAAAFDIYVEPVLPQPPRVLNFGFTSMPFVCPECGFAGMTLVNSKVTLCTHLCSFILCLFCCWPCAPLPYIMKSCKDVYHYCRNCRHFLGMYCPSNPEAYP